jgi:hypothetical protein
LSERALRIGRDRATEAGAVAPLVRSHSIVLCSLGRCVEAVPLAEEAVEKARAEKSRRRLIANLQSGSVIYAGAGDLDRADRALREAEALLKAQPRMTPKEHASLDYHLARLALAHGDAATAVEHAVRGLSRRADWETHLLELALAEACNERADFAAARAAAERALPIATELQGGLPHSLHVGRSRLELGVALAGLGDLDTGRAEVRRAMDHLEASVGPEAAPTKRAKARLAVM